MNKNTDKKVVLTLIVALVLAMSGILPTMVEIIVFYVMIVTSVVYLTGRLFIWGRDNE